MDITQDTINDLLTEYRRTKSPFKAAKAVGIDVKDAWEIIDRHKDFLTTPVERHGGMGRPEMQQFIVARRPVNSREWDNGHPDVANARFDFEAGTHTLATGRDGSWLILYAIPLRYVEPKPDYFQPMVG